MEFIYRPILLVNGFWKNSLESINYINELKVSLINFPSMAKISSGNDPVFVLKTSTNSFNKSFR